MLQNLGLKKRKNLGLKKRKNLGLKTIIKVNLKDYGHIGLRRKRQSVTTKQNDIHEFKTNIVCTSIFSIFTLSTQ